MTTIEEQLRRYAVQKVGPAVGEPPADLPRSSARGRGRIALVAAMVAFIAGAGLLALRAGVTEPSAPAGRSPDEPYLETATQLGVDLSNPVSLPAGPATCGGGTVGVELTGPQGAGLCVSGTPLENSPDVRVESYSNGARAGSMITVQPCNIENTPHLREFFAASSDGGRILYGPALPEVRTVVIAPEDGTQGSPLVATTFTLPTLSGLTFWAAYQPEGWSPGFPHHFDAAGDPVQIQEQTGPDACFPDGGPHADPASGDN